ENGFHQSKVTPSEQRDEQQHQVNLTFRVVPGPRAAVGEITLEGDAGYSVEEIKEIAKLHSGNTVDYVFKVDRGPVVEIAAEGFRLSQGVLHRLVPVYEEGAVDDDLLNEG